MTMTTAVVESMATLGLLEAEPADINIEDVMDTSWDAEIEDGMDTNSGAEAENNAGVSARDATRELAAVTGGQSLRIAVLGLPGNESTVLQVKARCTSQSKLEIEAYMITERHSERMIGQASRLLTTETAAERFFTAIQGNSLDVTFPIPGYEDSVVRAKARWDSRYGVEMMCGILSGVASQIFG
jgi:hypothetical protein